jgi:HlyD family secretion protein
VNVIADFADTVPALGDRYRVEARIVVWEGANVLKLPGSALFRTGDGWSVFVVEGGRARRRDVTVGHRSGFETEIVSGIAEGQVVIRDPTDRIADGVRVAVRKP